MNDLSEDDLAYLRRYGFDLELFQSWQRKVADGAFSKAHNQVHSKLCAPSEGQIHELPKSDADRRRLIEIGTESIRKGECGVVILNGGMATRFGGVVKGVVEVIAEKSFLELKIRDIARRAMECGGHVPVFLMNSFATDDATREHLEDHDWFDYPQDLIDTFTQFISVRMDADGEVFRTDGGEISPHGPGHGDFAPAFRDSGALERFMDRGGKHVLVANVDNLGARLSPLILGHHIDSRAEVTAEVTPKWPGDVGGSPFMYDGKLQLVEQIRYPGDFDPGIVDVFNTNTFHFTAASLQRDFELDWYYVDKTVEGRKAIQIERLIGEMTRFLKSNFVRVKRTGVDSRFFPIKTPDDLTAGRDEIRAMYADLLEPNDAGPDGGDLDD